MYTCDLVLVPRNMDNKFLYCTKTVGLPFAPFRRLSLHMGMGPLGYEVRVLHVEWDVVYQRFDVRLEDDFFFVDDDDFPFEFMRRVVEKGAPRSVLVKCDLENDDDDDCDIYHQTDALITLLKGDGWEIKE